MEDAFKYIALAGYDGIELSAINGMSEHLVLESWKELVPKIKHFSRQYNLELLAMEQPSLDPVVMEQAFQGCRRNRHSHCQLRPWREIERRTSLVKGSQCAGKLGADGGAVRCESVRKSPRRMQYLQHTNNPSRHG